MKGMEGDILRVNNLQLAKMLPITGFDYFFISLSMLSNKIEEICIKKSK